MASGIIFVLTYALLVGSTSGLGDSQKWSTRSPSGNERLRKELHDTKEASRGHNAATSKGGEDVERAVAVLEDKLRAMESLLLATRAELRDTKTEHQTTKRELQTERQTTKRELHSAKRELHAIKRELQTTKREFHVSKRNLQAIKREVHATRTERQTSNLEMASTFVRWGKWTCPSESTLVYAGRMGAKTNVEKGGGTNILCLALTPQFDNFAPMLSSHLVGARYTTRSLGRYFTVYCAVCRVPKATTIMIPGSLTCPPGWTTQYSGHLAAEYKTYGATEYVCLEESTDSGPESNFSQHTAFLFVVVYQCGQLPCPPYREGQVVTCVVCSK